MGSNVSDSFFPMHFRVCVCAQLYPILFDPMDSSPPGCSVHRIFQVKILEWVAISLVFKKNNFICLFIFDHAGSSLLSRLTFGYGGQKVFSSCGPLASHCSGFSCFRVWALEHVGFSNCGPPACRRQWHPTPVLLPAKSHGQRSLVGCSPWGC